MAAPTPTNDTFNFLQILGMNDSMIEDTKMLILLAIHDYPNDDYKKATFIMNKFQEKYGGFWTCCFYKNGQISTNYFDFWVHLTYKDYRISIWKSSR